MIKLGITTMVAVSVLGCFGCRRVHAPPRLPTLAANQPFIAFERDFEGFRDWPRIPVPPKARAQGITHTAGKRNEWINQKPAGGTKAFGVGTIIVKEIENGLPEGHRIFAMVKRGANYNPQGAKGWEWFELYERHDASASVGIQWRGINAPEGETYGSGDPFGGCNGCHETATGNDYVKADAADLRTLPGS